MGEYISVLINSKLVLKGLHFGLGGVILDPDHGRARKKQDGEEHGPPNPSIPSGSRKLIAQLFFQNMYWNGICQIDLSLQGL
jgi:hypothetical protein